MPGLPSDVGWVYRLPFSFFALLTMTAIASIYLITFDNDHNQQASVDDDPGRRDDGPGPPPVPSGSPPPRWLTAVKVEEKVRDEAGHRGRERAAGARPRRSRALARRLPDREHDRRRVVGVMPDLLIGDVHRHRGGERFPPPEVASKPRVRAARHLHANTVTAAEDVRRQARVGTSTAATPSPPRCQVAGVSRTSPSQMLHRSSRRLHIAEPDEEIRVLQRGPHVQIGGDRADHLEVADQSSAGVDQDVGAPLECPVVARSSRPGEQAAADRRRRVRRVIPVPIRSRPAGVRGCSMPPGWRCQRTLRAGGGHSSTSSQRRSPPTNTRTRERRGAVRHRGGACRTSRARRAGSRRRRRGRCASRGRW